MNEVRNQLALQTSRQVAGRGVLITAYVIACLVPLVNAGLYVHARRAAGVADGFPLDDSWIHAQYARTIAEGRPFEYAAGERSVGTTSVLFDLVWGGVAALTGEYVRTAHVLNILLTVGTAALLVALLLRFDLPALTAGFGAGMIVAGRPFPWSSLSGMETALATFLTTAAVLAHVVWGRGRGRRMLVAPVLMALAATARPENLVLFPLSELDLLIQRWRDGGMDGLKPAGMRFAARAAAFGLVLLPWFGLNWGIHGGLLPQTFAAKVGPDSLMADLAWNGPGVLLRRLSIAGTLVRKAYGYLWMEDNPILFLPISLGALSLFIQRTRRAKAADSLLPLLVFPMCVLATGLVTKGKWFPCQSQRYLIQWIPMALIYGVVGIHLAGCVAGRLARGQARAAYMAVVGAVFVVSGGMLVSMWPPYVIDYVASVKNINEMQVALGRWARDHTPPDAVIATNDIGAIAFFGERRIVDTVGLIDPEMVRLRRLADSTGPTIEYLRRRGVTHAMLFPSWHPDLILDPHFRGVDRVVLMDNVICGDDQMVVMKLDWDLKRPEPQPEWMAGVYETCRRWLERGGAPH
jgi:arabinofuranosyltransferase